MREKSVVPERDRESARSKHREEKCDLEPVDAKKPQVQGHGRDRQEQSADQKCTNQPIDSEEWNLWKHRIGRLVGGRFSGCSNEQLLSRTSADISLASFCKGLPYFLK